MRIAATPGNVLAALTVNIVRLLARRRPKDLLFIESRIRRDVSLDANDWLNWALEGFLEKLICAEHIAVVGHGHCWHTLPSSFGHQLGVLGGPVQHRVLGVYMQVDEAV